MAKRFPCKGRTVKTNTNKKRQLTVKYLHLLKASQKKKKNKPQGKYFCDKYPTLADFLSTVKIKDPTKDK